MNEVVQALAILLLSIMTAMSVLSYLLLSDIADRLDDIASPYTVEERP